MTAPGELYLPRSLVDELAEERAQALAAERQAPVGAPVVEGASEPIPWLPTALRTRSLGRQPSDQRLLEETKAWAAIAGRAVVRRLQAVEWRVEESTVADGTAEWEIVDGHPFGEALRRGNPIFTGRQIVGILAWHFLQVGQGYLQKVRDPFGVVRELWPMPPQLVTPVVGQSGLPEGYEIHPYGGGVVFLPFEDVVRIWDPDPLTLYSAMGVLGPQSTSWDASSYRDEHLREHFKHDATPRVVLQAEKEARLPTPDEREDYELDWRNRYNDRTGTNRGVPAITPPGFQVKELSAHGGQTETVPLGDQWRDQFMMAYGVSEAVLGKVDNANRANMEAALFGFDLLTIDPIAKLFADSLTYNVVEEFGDGLRVGYEEFVAPDKDFELRREKQDLETKVTSPDEVRVGRGWEPATEWNGTQPVGSIADQPYTGEPAETGESDFDFRSAREEKPPEEPARLTASGYFSLDESWQRQVDAEETWSPRWLRAQLQVFTIQANDVVRRLREEWVGPRSARIALEDLFGVAWWRDLFVRRIERPIRQPMYGETLGETTDALGVDFDFDTSEQAILRGLGARSIANINRTTADRIRRILAKGLDAGWGIDQMERELRSTIIDPKRAKTIARTETLTTSQTAQMEGFAIGGVPGKRWNHSLAADERPHHLAYDGTVVPRGDLFQLATGAEGAYPGDPRLGAGEIINCRCFVTPVFQGG